MEQLGVERAVAPALADVTQVRTVEDLAAVLRQLRRRDARCRAGRQVTYRELAARTGWSLGIITEYLRGRILPPTDRFDTLVRLLGAGPAEQGALATARDRIEEARRRTGPVAHHPGGPGRAPHQLPPDILGFAGRAAELAELDDLLRRSAATTAAVATISGTAGVGKTALAVHWAHRVAEQFPDGQLYVDLHGFTSGRAPMTPAEVLRQLLEALAVPLADLPVGLDAQAARYRSQLAGRRVLIVLDNACRAEQVRPLLAGTSGCLTVVTSRRRLSGLGAAVGGQPINLDLPTMAEARTMLAGRVRAERLAAEPAAADELITLSARLPLALAVVSFRAASRPAFPLQALAEELRAVRGGLDGFTDDDPVVDVRAVFALSYDALDADAARLFRLLALPPEGGVTIAAAASLAGVGPARARRLIGQLADAHLVTELAPGRFCPHELLRAYAAELLGRVETPADRRAATCRLLDHHLHTAHTAALLLDPHRTGLPLSPPARGCQPEELGTYAAARAWLAAEHPVLVAAVRLAADAGFDPHAWRLAWTLTTYLDRQGRWAQLADVHGLALAATIRSAGPGDQARAHGSLGRAYAMQGRYAPAHRHLELAVAGFRQLGERAGLSCAHIDLAQLHELQGRPMAALAHADRALRLYRAADHATGRARAMSAVGRFHCQLGDPVRALLYGQHALDVQRITGDRRGAAITWESLGATAQRLGRHRDAVSCLEQAVELSHGLGDRYYEAQALARLGDAMSSAGDRRSATAAWEQASSILTELGRLTDASALTGRPAALARS